MDLTDALSSSRLEIHLLGRFAVFVDGEPLKESDIKGRKARSLLKLIAQRRHHQMVRDHLINILWPELEEEAAASQLYKALHHIRKAFSAHAEEATDWITITDELVRLDPPGGLITDLQQFEQKARTGLRDRHIPDLETAVSIYAGDFLPMDRYAEWGALPREHYRQLYLDVLTVLAVEYEQRGDLSDAAEMLRLALEKEPALETAHRNLMRIFARQGQSTRAFRQYDLCREVLRDELGMSPSPETKKILDDIREGRLSQTGEHETLRATIPEPVSPIIGRTEECRILDSLIDRLSGGEGGALLVSGEMGMGKTRLVRELINRSRQKTLTFYLGRTSEGTGAIAYEPFIELFEDILHHQQDLKNMLPVELKRLIPGFSGDGDPVPHADKLAAKSYLFARVHQFFSKLAEQEPYVIIVEDLHNADRGSRELFTYLVRHRAGLPLLFGATVRKELDGSEPAIIADLKDQNPELIDLSPLSADEHLNLLYHHAGTSGISPEKADHIYRLSEGNPLFSIELFQYSRDDELLSPAPYTAQSGGEATPGFTGRMPNSIRTIVEHKMEGLSASAHHLLYIAAVIGRKVTYELMASVWENSDYNGKESLFDALEEVIRARLLNERGLDYSFRHAIVREAIYASISEARRTTLHRLTARQLSELSNESDNEPVEQIAYHFLRARDTIKGTRYLMRAGERAEKAYAHDDALQRYGEARAVLQDTDDHEALVLKCELLERIGDVYRACGQLEKSYGAYEEAIELAESISLDRSGQVELHRKMAVAAIFRTEIDRSEQYLVKAFDLVGEDDRARARLSITKALHLWHLNKLEEAYDTARQALELAEETGADSEASQACEILAMTCLPLGRWQEGLEYEMQRQLYGWSPEIVVATDAHLCLWEYHVSGDQPLRKASSFISKVAEQASELGDMRCVAVCHYALGTMHLWRGQRRRAVDELSSSLELHERVGSPAGMAYSLARKSVLHTLMGATDLGWQAVQEGLTHAGRASVRDHCLQRLYGVGIWNRLEASESEDARRLVEESETLLNETGACGACALELYPWLAYFYLHTGDITAAKRCGEAVSNIVEQTGNPIGKSIAAMIEANLSITDQDEKQAEQCSRQSFEILNEAVAETDHSPVAHYLNRMVEQQAQLRV